MIRAVMIGLVSLGLASCVGHRASPNGNGVGSDTPAKPALGERSIRDTLPVSPQLAAFRNQLLDADDVQWRRLDLPYLRMKAVLGQIVVGDLEYPQFLGQLAGADADIRANGMCGLAASKSPAAADHLARALRNEPDPYNRTIAVWCLRVVGNDRRIAKALMDYLTTCRDIDLGRYLAPDGSVRDFKSPFPLAAFEAFKGLVAMRGKDEMLSGRGWQAFVARVGKNIDPEPITALNVERLKARPGRPRTDPAANLRKWIEEMRE